jgi:hypothetical protein
MEELLQFIQNNTDSLIHLDVSDMTKIESLVLDFQKIIETVNIHSKRVQSLHLDIPGKDELGLCEQMRLRRICSSEASSLMGQFDSLNLKRAVSFIQQKKVNHFLDP